LAAELDLTGAVPGSENFNARSQGYVGLLVLLAVALTARRLSPPFRRCATIAVAALAVAWRIPPLAAIWAATPVIRWVAPEYAAVPLCLFASLAAGPALEALASGPDRPRLGAALLALGVVLAAAGLAPATGAGRRGLASAGDAAVRVLRTRGHLRQAPEVYAERMGRYIAAARFTALRRAAIPGLLFAAAGWALA